MALQDDCSYIDSSQHLEQATSLLHALAHGYVHVVARAIAMFDQIYNYDFVRLTSYTL
jgi:hypothetical protein